MPNMQPLRACMRRPATGGSRCQTRKPVSGGSSSATKDTGATSMACFTAWGERLRCAREKMAEYRRVINEARRRRRTWSAPRWRNEVEWVKRSQDWGIMSHGGARRRKSEAEASDGPTSKPAIGGGGEESHKEVRKPVGDGNALDAGDAGHVGRWRRGERGGSV